MIVSSYFVMTEPQTESGQPFLPHYRVVGFIGEGAAARIYRVIDERSGAVRAVKALKPESNAETSIVKRFEDEYLILRRLHHPSLPEVYDYGFTDDGIRYIVMELVEGEPLDAYFEKHRDDLWLLLYEMCEVLSFIHDRDLLHLDLKPANILVKRTTAYGDEKPMVVLMDFGLSYRRDVGGERSLVGTPEYMAPEIIRGDGRLTRAVDYYSLGITLYQLLTGQPPFRGEIKEVFSGHLRQEVRFQQEKTEYAELYPHVLGLTSKDINDRLEAFEGFRQAVGGRLGGGIGHLELEYGLSAIWSIGLIGKESALNDIIAWFKAIYDYVDAYRAIRVEKVPERISAARGNTVQPTNQVDVQSWSLTRDLLSEAKEPSLPRIQTTAKAPPRVYLLSGPSGYGKTYIVDKLVELKRLESWAIWRLSPHSSNDIVSTYDSAISGHEKTFRRSGFIDPQSAVVDHYVAAWDLLNSDKSSSATILVVDGFEDLDSKQLGFLDYISKRMQIVDVTLKPAIVYVVIIGVHPKLDDLGCDIFGVNQIVSNALSPLNESDVQNTINCLHGHYVTPDDRRYLEGYLSKFREEPGAIPAALEDMMKRGFFVYNKGQWRFDPSEDHEPSVAISSLSQYYKEIPNQIPEDAREVLDWIVCHNGAIPVQRISEISGIRLSDIRKAIDIITPFRILTFQTYDELPSVGVLDRRVQKSLSDVINRSRIEQIHHKYVRAYEEILKSSPNDSTITCTANRQQLIYHYVLIGAFRPTLVHVIKAIRDLSSSNHFYELKTFCSDALATLSEMGGQSDSFSVQFVRRYVLKHAIEAAWSLNDYDSVKSITSKYFTGKYDRIPLSVAFKHCLSLIFHNEFGAALSVAMSIKRQFPNHKSQAYNAADMIQANVLIQTGQFKNALGMLTRIENNKNVLTEYQKCRLYSSFLILYERLSDEDGISKYVPLVEEISLRNGFHHEFQFSLLAPFNFAFNKSLLTECKHTARKAIAVASRARSYRRLVDWYLRASGVYYEDGAYDRAIKYVNKALPLAERLGLPNEVPSLVIRLAMNYLNAGAFGNAIVHVERALEIWNEDYNVINGAVIHLFAFEAHLTANSRHVKTYFRKASQYMRRHKEVKRWGYYWYLIGIYNHRNGDYEGALKSLKRSRLAFKNEGAIDDAVRSGLKEIVVLLDIGRYAEASALIKKLREPVKGLESKNIKIEFSTVCLLYQYHGRANRHVLYRQLLKCEQALGGAREVPVLLAAEKTIFRVKARIGDVSGARQIFKVRLKRIKTILSNMPNREYALDFLSNHDEQLLLEESRLLERKGARASVPR